MVSERLKEIILDTLGLSHHDIHDETSAHQVPGWDSLTHASIMVAVERNAEVRFSAREVVRLQNVGELQRLINVKLEETGREPW